MTKKCIYIFNTFIQIGIIVLLFLTNMDITATLYKNGMVSNSRARAGGNFSEVGAFPTAAEIVMHSIATNTSVTYSFQLKQAKRNNDGHSFRESIFFLSNSFPGVRASKQNFEDKD